VLAVRLLWVNVAIASGSVSCLAGGSGQAVDAVDIQWEIHYAALAEAAQKTPASVVKMGLGYTSSMGRSGYDRQRSGGGAAVVDRRDADSVRAVHDSGCVSQSSK
jgi:hypothetical protein